jgi:hypothetical protein
MPLHLQPSGIYGTFLLDYYLSFKALVGWPVKSCEKKSYQPYTFLINDFQLFVLSQNG